MAVCLKHYLTRHVVPNSRSFYYKFERVYKPPLPEPKESPYIVGPYLKPDYVPVEYTTEAIKHRNDNDLNFLIYKPTKIEMDHERTVKLLLIEDVEGLGVAGQVVDANYRYGASKLVAMKKAEYATEFAKKWYKFGPKTTQSASSALSPRTIRLLKAAPINLPISRDANVQPWHLSLALRLSGFYCPKEVIESIDEYIDEQDLVQIKCIVRVNNHERVVVKFNYSSFPINT